MRANGTPQEPTMPSPALLRSAHTEPQASVSEPPQNAQSAPRSRKSPQPPTPLRHRSTRTLNPLAPGAAAPSKPNFHIHYTHEHAETQSCFLRNDSFRKKQDYNPKKRFTGCCYDTVLDPASNRVLSC